MWELGAAQNCVTETVLPLIHVCGHSAVVLSGVTEAATCASCAISCRILDAKCLRPQVGSQIWLILCACAPFSERELGALQASNGSCIHQSVADIASKVNASANALAISFPRKGSSGSSLKKFDEVW